MRLFQVAAIAAVSFLLVSEALPVTPVSNRVQIQDVASPGDSNQRLLRGRHVEYDNDSEARTIKGIEKFSKEHQKELIKFAKSIGFDPRTGAGYIKVPEKKMKEYLDLYNLIHAMYHPKTG
ncbi:RxLR effector protein [Phytophthora megakarya]|uniref:RxLR effector protein n=1 Tax=Phytophthora megakarya TaxID=4795 RepID=A0A225VDU5_9STRA|nr:RxLR effector protein [Phytophthora megakarya]